MEMAGPDGVPVRVKQFPRKTDFKSVLSLMLSLCPGCHAKVHRAKPFSPLCRRSWLSCGESSSRKGMKKPNSLSPTTCLLQRQSHCFGRRARRVINVGTARPTLTVSVYERVCTSRKGTPRPQISRAFAAAANQVSTAINDLRTVINLSPQSDQSLWAHYSSPALNLPQREQIGFTEL